MGGVRKIRDSFSSGWIRKGCQCVKRKEKDGEGEGCLQPHQPPDQEHPVLHIRREFRKENRRLERKKSREERSLRSAKQAREESERGEEGGR